MRAGDMLPPMEFYGAASQVIPLLFLTLVFQTGALDRQPDSYDPSRPEDPSHWNVTQAIGRWYAILLLTVGECLALLALYQGRTPAPATKALVWLALLIGVLGTASPLLGRQWSHVKAWWRTEARADWWLAASFAVGMVGLSAIWVLLFY